MTVWIASRREGDAIAILVNRTDQKVVRLRQGESLGGWSPTSVQPREVTFKQGERSEVLALPGRSRGPARGCRRQADNARPGRSGVIAFRAPLHAKNGESDGL